jgi:hypothetical protein
MTEHEPPFRLHTIDRAAQEGSERFNREYHLHVAGVGHFSAQVLFPSGRFAIGGDGSLDGEDLVKVQACVPPVGLHLGFQSWKVAREIRAVLRALGVQTVAFQEYETSLRIFDWAVWWDVFAPAHEWSRRAAPWRRGAWHPFGHPGQRIGDEEDLAQREDTIELDEGPQACTLTLSRGRFRSRLFPALVVTRSFVSFDFKPAIDLGGSKGPVSWMGVNAESFEDAIYKMRVRILTERAKSNWRAPSPVKAAS